MNDYEIRKQEEDKQRKKEERIFFVKKKIKQAIPYLLILGCIGLLVFGWQKITEGDKPVGPDMSVEYPIQSREHIKEGAPHPAYNSNPPSGGWHYASPAVTGFYAKNPPPDEQIIHNLEHGDIWIAFNPRISSEMKEKLKALSRLRVIITERPKNETDIALVAWGRVDTFNLEGTFPETRILDFMKRYMNQGPEKLPPGAHMDN